MSRANSGVTWVRQPHVQEFLQQLVSDPVITHKRLDSIKESRTREHVRGLLVEHHVLPRRDERLAQFQHWSTQALTRVELPEHREVIERFVRWRWHPLRRMNQMDTITQGTFLRSKQTVTVAINLLNWLGRRDRSLTLLSQADLDEWQATGPTTREIASRFLSWARKSNLVTPDLKMTPHRRGTSPRLSTTAQEVAIEHTVRGTRLVPRDRLAAALVLVCELRRREQYAALEATAVDLREEEDLDEVLASLKQARHELAEQRRSRARS